MAKKLLLILLVSTFLVISFPVLLFATALVFCFVIALVMLDLSYAFVCGLIAIFTVAVWLALLAVVGTFIKKEC